MIVQPGWAFITFGAHELGSGETLSTFSFDGAVVVITTIDVVNSSGAEGDGFQLFNNPGNTLFHAGERGAGSFDSFPWRGELLLPGGNSVGINVFGGIWDVRGSGYLVPNTAAQMQMHELADLIALAVSLTNFGALVYHHYCASCASATGPHLDGQTEKPPT